METKTQLVAEGNKLKSVKNKNSNNEAVLETFQTLRNEQRSLIGKMSELELDLNEHK